MAQFRFRENPGIQKYPRNEMEWTHWINEVNKWIGDLLDVQTAQTTADGAQTDATTGIANAATAQTDATTGIANAATAQTQADLSGHQGIGMNFVWHTDNTGTKPADASTRDLIATFYDESGTSIATRTLRGTFTAAGPTIAVTAQATTGETTTYALVDDGTTSVWAIVTHTASKKKGTCSWSYVDETTAGGTPVSGGGK